ncbi:MAG: NosD domain-containing protein, partial [Bacteroidales bacterium]|nr:NosD domain-containing protein [Bacteroidales bacterium]
MKKITLLCIAVLMTVFTAIGQTIVLNEDFESAPYDLASSGTIQWGINSRLHASGSFSDSCTVGLSSTSYLTTNSFSTTGNTSVLLEFKHICKIESGDAGQLEYSIDGGTTWTLITNTYYLGAGMFTSNKFNEGSYVADWQFGVAAAVPQNTWWKTELFDLGTLVGNQANVKIRFKLSDPNNQGANQRLGWYIDDVKVTIAPSELVPPTITLLPVIYQDTVYGSGPFDIKAKISDISGISTATLFYSVNSGAYSSIPMAVVSADTFHASVPAQAFDTRIDYYITAVDASLAANPKTSDTTWFYVKEPSPVVIIGTGTSTTNLLPCYGYYNYGWSAQLYNSYEINSSGMIDTLCFYVGNAPTAGYTMTNQRLMLAEVTDTIFSTTAMPDSATMSTYFAGDVVWTGPGWYKFIPVNPFYYSGTGSLLAYWINRDGSYGSGYPYFQYTATPTANKAKYTYSDTYSSVFPTSSGTLVTSRPNIRIVFNNNANDVAMTQMTEPASTPVPTVGPTYNSKIIFANLGSDNLTTLTINWSIDGVLQAPYSWTGSLAQSQSSGEITLGTLVFASAGYHTIKAWSSLPNGVADEAPANDTISKTLYVCQTNLSGTYTIDPLTPTGGTNFKYFADAMGSLMNCGISDTTVFNISAGTYDTTLTFNGAIPGAGPSACVIFQSASGVNTDVTLRNNATASASNYIVKLNGTSRVQFKNMTLLTQGTSYGTAINLGGGSHYNLFEGNIIGGQTTTSTSSDMALIYNSGTVNDTNNIVRNNVLNNGSYGIYWYGVSTTNLEKNSVIEGNTLNNFYYYGIYTNYQHGIVMSGNTLKTNTAYASVIGMYLYYNDYSIIEKNNIVVPSYYGMYLYECDADSTTRCRIVNNMVQVGGSSTSYGLYTSYCDYANVYHNTFNSSSSSGRSMYIYYGGNLDLKNNFITNTGGGYSIYSVSATTVFESDYNNLYTTGAVLGYNGANTVDIAAWRTSTGKDSNSVSITPAYYGTSDLHTMAFATNGLATPLGITEDIDGEPRSMITPDMGADEFETPPFEAQLLSVISPLGGCGLGVEDVIIRVKNNGSDTINGNFTATYVVNNGTPVTEAITATLLPMETYDFTFAATVDMYVGFGNDSLFNFDAWVTLLNDTIHQNDSISFSANSLHSPAVVVVTNDTIPYGTAATLTATSVDTIQWFADPALTTLLATGTSYTTPVLYDTTVYYVASTSAMTLTYTFDSDLEGWTANTPCASYTTYNWAWASDGGAGAAWMVNPTTYSSAVLQSPVIPVSGDSIDLSFRHRYYTESCCDRGYVAYRIDGGAWNHFTPTTGLYAGSDNLNIDPILAACTSGPTVGTFGGSATTYFVSSGKIPMNGGNQIEIAFAFSSDVSAGYDGWFIDEVSIYKPGCPGPISPDTVFLSGVPAADVGVIAIDEPNDGIELSNNETVTVRVKNYGTATASNIPVNFTINAGTAVTETLAGPV